MTNAKSSVFMLECETWNNNKSYNLVMESRVKYVSLAFWYALLPLFYQEILHKLGGIEDLAQVRLPLW